MPITRALIPAAGRGARLDRPGTPKPLVHVGGEPLIVRLLRQFQTHGITRATVVLGYAADEIERALTRHPALDIALDFIRHDHWREGLASSLLAARHHFDAPFLLAMADHVFDDAIIETLVELEPPPGGVFSVVDTDPGRLLELDDAVKIRGALAPTAYGRHLPTYDAIDCGLFLADPALFPAIETSRGDDLTHGLHQLARAGNVRGLRIAEHGWDDVDTPAGLIHAEMRLRERARARILEAAAVPPPPEPSYTFQTGAPTTTEIVIRRGAVRDPLAAGVIPPESASSPVFVFTDETVDRLYGDAFCGPLQAAGYTVHRIVMADGEESKTLSNYTYLAERVLAKGLDERSVLVSLGGGAVCNVCGLLAATLYRGVGLVHVPTTVMAQCDAAISHKQGVNGARGKNLVGAYYAPRRIIVDVDVLATLDDRFIPDGLAEVLKHALAQDPDFIIRLLDYKGSRRDPAFLESVIRRNIELKCALMVCDPKEHRQGMALQYGHTVGHPIEHLSGYRITHGESVAIGMVVAARVARILGACDDRTVALHERLIAAYGLPTEIPAEMRTADILAGLKYNKRYLMEGTRMALVHGPGALWSVDGDYAIPVSDEVLARAIDQSRAGVSGEQRSQPRAEQRTEQAVALGA